MGLVSTSYVLMAGLIIVVASTGSADARSRSRRRNDAQLPIYYQDNVDKISNDYQTRPRPSSDFEQHRRFDESRNFGNQGSDPFAGQQTLSLDEQQNQVVSGKDVLNIFGITTASTFGEFIRTVGGNFLLFLDIILKQVAIGTRNIMNNLKNHEDGGINVPAETPIAATFAKLAHHVLEPFLLDRWNGIVSHVVQEAIDRFVSASQDFFTQIAHKHSSLGRI